MDVIQLTVVSSCSYLCFVVDYRRLVESRVIVVHINLWLAPECIAAVHMSMKMMMVELIVVRMSCSRLIE